MKNITLPLNELPYCAPLPTTDLLAAPGGRPSHRILQTGSPATSLESLRILEFVQDVSYFSKGVWQSFPCKLRFRLTSGIVLVPCQQAVRWREVRQERVVHMGGYVFTG